MIAAFVTKGQKFVEIQKTFIAYLEQKHVIEPLDLELIEENDLRVQLDV